MATKKVTFLDNSGFAVETPDVIMVFDYYRDPAHKVVAALEKEAEKPVVFFVTHHHPDHFNSEIFNLGQNHKRYYVLSNDILDRKVPDTLAVDWMSRGDVVEDLPGILKVEAFGSTDSGVSYVVTLADGSRLFHAGDLNNWHWENESTEREAQKAKEAYTVILNRIAESYPALDVVFFPVDTRLGDNCAAGAVQLLTAIKVKNFFPMHFKGDYEQACNFDGYKLAEDVAARTLFHCLHKPGESVELQ